MQCPKCKRDTLRIHDNFNSVCEDCWRLPIFFDEKIQSLEEQNKILQEAVASAKGYLMTFDCAGVSSGDQCSYVYRNVAKEYHFKRIARLIQAQKQCDELQTIKHNT